MADIVRLRDYEPRQRVAAHPVSDAPATIVILPVVRIERAERADREAAPRKHKKHPKEA